MKGRLYYVAPCDEQRGGHIVRTWDVMRRVPHGPPVAVSSGHRTRAEAIDERDLFLRAAARAKREAA